jgi:phage regulator Rha-like protein
LAAGKLDTVWVRTKRVPKTLKNYHGICEVGSTLGKAIEVDMETFRKTGSIRNLVGVVNHKNIHAMAKLTTKKLMIYYIYFQGEHVVEEGWLRPEEEYIQEFDEMEDALSQELGDRGRRNKELKKVSELIKETTLKQVSKLGRLWKKGKKK